MQRMTQFSLLCLVEHLDSTLCIRFFTQALRIPVPKTLLTSFIQSKVTSIPVQPHASVPVLQCSELSPLRQAPTGCLNICVTAEGDVHMREG